MSLLLYFINRGAILVMLIKIFKYNMPQKNAFIYLEIKNKYSDVEYPNNQVPPNGTWIICF